MPLELQPATEADAGRSVDIERAAYALNPLTRILFPGPFPATAADDRAKLLTTELKSDPTTRWFKVVDPELPEAEQMVAFAKFHVFTERKHPAPRSFGPGCNVEACELLFSSIAKLRERTQEHEDGSYIYFHLLHADPKHQGRGAGGMLVKRCIEEARKLGVTAYLEATEAGHAVYKKYGFRDVECLSLDLSKWGLAELANYWSMVYDPREAVEGEADV